MKEACGLCGGCVEGAWGRRGGSVRAECSCMGPPPPSRPDPPPTRPAPPHRPATQFPHSARHSTRPATPCPPGLPPHPLTRPANPSSHPARAQNAGRAAPRPPFPRRVERHAGSCLAGRREALGCTAYSCVCAGAEYLQTPPAFSIPPQTFSGVGAASRWGRRGGLSAAAWGAAWRRRGAIRGRR